MAGRGWVGRGEGRGEGGKAGGSGGRGGPRGGSPLTSLGNRRRQRPARSPAVWSGVVPPPPHKEIPRTHTPPPRAVTQHRGPGTRPAASGGRRRRELPAQPALPLALSLTHTLAGRRRAGARPYDPRLSLRTPGRDLGPRTRPPAPALGRWRPHLPAPRRGEQRAGLGGQRGRNKPRRVIRIAFNGDTDTQGQEEARCDAYLMPGGTGEAHRTGLCTVPSVAAQGCQGQSLPSQFIIYILTV